ncbi:MAG: thioredoxin family protein [candidate division WOR-3 bacterium]|nr:thioredoxin family protein [candidate division WOR-3 bacterium]
MKSRLIIITLITAIIMVTAGCRPSHEAEQGKKQINDKVEVEENESAEQTVSEEARDSEITLRFLEIGSDECVPCKMMRPVMEKVTENYDNVRVLFYEINSDSGQAVARKYKVRLIPTQIFLDNDGNIVKRHEGFYAYDDMSVFIDKFIEANK